jgi:hypothetical protein
MSLQSGVQSQNGKKNLSVEKKSTEVLRRMPMPMSMPMPIPSPSTFEQNITYIHELGMDTSGTANIDNVVIYNQNNIPEPISFSDIMNDFHKSYRLYEKNNSMVLDIITTYIKGQKILYTEAKTICEQRLHAMMLPAIFNTALCTILSLVLQVYPFGSTIVSSLNGINAFMLALVNYFKLDARAEAHRTTAYRLDKLESYLTFNSGKTLFVSKDELDKDNVTLYEILKIVEKEVRDIKDTNQFVLPEYIRYHFPDLYGKNVFEDVKKIINEELVEFNILKDIINRIERQKHKIKTTNFTNEQKVEEYKILNVMEIELQDKTESILQIQNKYLDLGDSFEKEMKTYRELTSRGFTLFSWMKS